MHRLPNDHLPRLPRALFKKIIEENLIQGGLREVLGSYYAYKLLAYKLNSRGTFICIRNHDIWLCQRFKTMCSPCNVQGVLRMYLSTCITQANSNSKVLSCDQKR